MRGNRTGRGWFKKGQSGNPSGLPKTPPVLLEFAPHTDDPDGADRRTVGNLVVEARKYSGLAVDTLVELTKNTHTDSTRYAAATALLDRGYGRPAQSLDLHLSADAITKRLSDMTDAELAALEARMIAAAPIVLEATADVSGDDVEDSPAGCPCLTPHSFRIRPRPHSVSDSPPIFDALRTFAKSNASYATIWSITATHP